MIYDPFVIPFCVGAIILILTLAYRYLYWIITLSKADRFKFLKGIFSYKIFTSCKEVFTESLVHRKVFKINPLLGYMHMSFALGWLLLILGGTIESKIHTHRAFNAPYEPIFFKFFNHNFSGYTWVNEFKFIMDFILLVILLGVALALIKRIYSRLFGMKKTTRLKLGDWLAMMTLWFIFPLRFLAESFTSGTYHNGGFLTGTAGNFFASFLPVEHLSYIAWWAYSTVLALFFIALPYSRYMHIFTEVVLIFLRNFGIRNCKVYNSFSAIEVHSCSRCGICIDKCKLLKVAHTKDVQSVYFLQSIRYNNINQEKAFDCLLCGRCQAYCPVGININNIRISKRFELATGNHNFKYLSPIIEKPAPVIYFAGCMTHLTPSIKIAMESILKASGTEYLFLDKDGSICCGRPLMTAGEIVKAHKLIEKNTKLIKDSGAKTLVTSCPICLKVFKEDYLLNIEVMHHSQYILRLQEEGKIKLNKLPVTTAYHDPCELGRGSLVYEEPRKLLHSSTNFQEINQSREKSLCCGNSLGGLQLNTVQRDLLRIHALNKLEQNNPDVIVTGCPLCKKTFANGATSEVKDIAEIAWMSIRNGEKSCCKEAGDAE